MSYSDYRKVLKQIQNKPAKLKRFMKHNTPKKIKYGARVKRCSLSGNPHAYIQKYGLNLSRQAFRQIATKLGFKKYN